MVDAAVVEQQSQPVVVEVVVAAGDPLGVLDLQVQVFGRSFADRGVVVSAGWGGFLPGVAEIFGQRAGEADEVEFATKPRQDVRRSARSPACRQARARACAGVGGCRRHAY